MQLRFALASLGALAVFGSHTTAHAQAYGPQLLVGAGNGGSLQIIEQYQVYGEGPPFLQAWQNPADGSWNAGFTLPKAWPSSDPYAPYNTLALGTGNDGTLQVLGMGQVYADAGIDTNVFLADWQDTSGAWHAGFTLPGPPQGVHPSSLATGNSNNAGGLLQVLGVADNGYAYLFDSQDATGQWHEGFLLPNQTTTLDNSLAVGNGNGGALQVVGLSAADGSPYLVGWQDSAGDWHGGFKLPSLGPLNWPVLVPGNGGALQLLGIDNSGNAVLSAWQDPSDGTWHPGQVLPGQVGSLWGLAAAPGDGGALQVVALDQAGASPYLIAWQDGTGNWNPGFKLPAAGTGPFSELNLVPGNGGALQVIALDDASDTGQAWLLSWQDPSDGSWHAGSALPEP